MLKKKNDFGQIIEHAFKWKGGDIMKITSTEVRILDTIKDEDNLPHTIVLSSKIHTWKKPYESRYIDNVKNNDRIYELLTSSPFLADVRSEEYGWLVCMKTHGELIGIYEISHGATNVTVMDIKQILNKAVLAGTVIAVLVHNHPTGDSTPSDIDRSLTNQFFEAFRLNGIYLYDHLVIAKDGYHGMIDRKNITKEIEGDFVHQGIYSEAIESFIDFCDNMQIVQEEYNAPTYKDFRWHPIRSTAKVINHQVSTVMKSSIKSDGASKYREQENKRNKYHSKMKEIVNSLNIQRLQIPDGMNLKDKNEVKVYCEQAQQRSIQYIKKCTMTPGYKKKYQTYFPLIKVTPDNNVNDFDIRITQYPDGYDSNRIKQYEKSHPGISDRDNPWMNNDWYNDLLVIGQYIIDKVFDPEIGYSNGIGDGESGVIYVHTIAG